MASYWQRSQPRQAGGQGPLTNGGQRGVISKTRLWKSKLLGYKIWIRVLMMALLLGSVFVTYMGAPEGSDFFRGLPGSSGEHGQQRLLQESSEAKKKTNYRACKIDFARGVDEVRVPKPWDMYAVFEGFQLNYIQSEETPENNSRWKPRFAGHQSLAQREESYVTEDHTCVPEVVNLHCGFVEAEEGSLETGFELSEADTDYLQTCQIVVSSAIFGNYDHVRNPTAKEVSLLAKETVCFTLFVDQQGLDGMIEEGQVPDANMTIGFWRIVLIKTLPYRDNRRNGKVPKFLAHRLFPNAGYSIWLDSKLRLQSDPLLILDHFLWRDNYEYAISNHYARHSLQEEVARNKERNKFNHGRIDQQFAFYQKDGLTQFNACDPHRLLLSDVPEGSFIVRAHTPMSNLFSCLWFNEVDRFTPRDQLSFAYTYQKFVRTNPSRLFRFNMFKDCERRKMVKLYHHK